MKKSFGQTVGGAADHIVGDIILGGIGRAGFHLNKVPGVGHVGRYVGGNIRDGYRAAERNEHKREAIGAIRKLQTSSGVAFTPDQIRTMAVKAGVAEADLDAVQKAAQEHAASMKKTESTGGLPRPEGYGAPAPAAAGA